MKKQLILLVICFVIILMGLRELWPADMLEPAIGWGSLVMVAFLVTAVASAAVQLAEPQRQLHWLKSTVLSIKICLGILLTLALITCIGNLFVGYLFFLFSMPYSLVSPVLLLGRPTPQPTRPKIVPPKVIAVGMNLGSIAAVLAILGATTVGIPGPPQVVFGREIREGNLAVKEIEKFRDTHGRLPTSLQEAGLKEKPIEAKGLYYRRCGTAYELSFPTGFDSSLHYNPQLRQWTRNNMNCLE